MTMQTPLVSVCMTAYNHEPYLRGGDRRVLAQRTDFAVEPGRGRGLQHGPHAGDRRGVRRRLPRPRAAGDGPGNIGWRANYLRTFEACRGKYVAYCDGDDWWCDPGKLQRQVDLLEADPACGMCYTRADNFYQATGRREPDEEVHFTDFGRLLRSLTICNCRPWRGGS